MARDQERRRPLPVPPAGTRVAVLSSTYHRDVIDAMRRSAVAALAEAGLATGDVIELDAPGAFELPVLARALARRDDVDAVLCFGLVLKGETDHDGHIARSVAHGLQDVALATGKPVLFGVLTCANLAQAERRARPVSEGGLDKGREVAAAALEALLTLHRITARAAVHRGSTP